jgi:hypothetical protein
MRFLHLRMSLFGKPVPTFPGHALILACIAFAVLTAAITSRIPKWLTDFDQGLYITIAYDLDRHGVFSNGVFDQTDSTQTTPPPGMFFGPVYPALVATAMRIDARFREAVACAVEAQHGKRDHKTCEVYARPIHLLHACCMLSCSRCRSWRSASRRS